MNQTARIAQASQTVIKTQGPAAHWPSGPLSGGRTPLAGQPGPPQVAPCQCTHSCPSALNSLPSQRLSWSSLDPFTFPTGVTLTPPPMSLISKQKLSKGKRLVQGHSAKKPGAGPHTATKLQPLSHLCVLSVQHHPKALPAPGPPLFLHPTGARS